jgi:methyl-accepting chemotaxis protein
MNNLFRQLSLNLPTFYIFMIAGGVPFLLALVLSISIAKQRYDDLMAVNEVNTVVELISGTSDLSHNIQQEFTIGTGVVATNGTMFMRELQDTWVAVDDKAAELDIQLASANLSPELLEPFQAFVDAALGMPAIREIAAQGTSSSEEIYAMIDAVELAHDAALLKLSEVVTDPSLSADILNLRDLMKVKYAIAREQAMLVGGAARGYLTAEDTIGYFRQSAMQQAFKDELAQRSTDATDQALRALDGFDRGNSIDQYREALLTESLSRYEPLTLINLSQNRLAVARDQQLNLLATIQATCDRLAAIARSSMMFVTALALVALGGAAFLIVGFSGAFSELLRTMAERAERMTQGDLDVKLPKAGKNPVSQLIRSLAKFRDSARQTRDEAAERLLRDQQELENIRQRSEAEKMRAARIASDLEQTAQSAEELATSVASAAASTRTVDDLAKVVRQKTTEGDQEVQSAMGAMDRISSAQNEITSIIATVEEIAFQTNLLALNARVEAARAGEYGRGFAVVATEVQQLAARSTRAANEVGGLIEKASAEIDGGVKIVKQSGKTLSEISKGNAEIAETINSVAGMLEQQSQSLNDISSAAGRLDNEMRALSSEDSMPMAAE